MHVHCIYQIIYVVSRKKPRTIQYRLYLCAEHTAVWLWVEKPKASRRATQRPPKSSRDPAHVCFLNLNGGIYSGLHRCVGMMKWEYTSEIF